MPPLGHAPWFRPPEQDSSHSSQPLLEPRYCPCRWSRTGLVQLPPEYGNGVFSPISELLCYYNWFGARPESRAPWGTWCRMHLSVLTAQSARVLDVAAVAATVSQRLYLYAIEGHHHAFQSSQTQFRPLRIRLAFVLPESGFPIPAHFDSVYHGQIHRTHACADRGSHGRLRCPTHLDLPLLGNGNSSIYEIFDRAIGIE